MWQFIFAWDLFSQKSRNQPHAKITKYATYTIITILDMLKPVLYFQEGPPVAEMISILGKEETLNRLKYAQEKLTLPL